MMKSLSVLILCSMLWGSQVARSQTVWMKSANNPVLDAGPAGGWDNLGAGAPRVIRILDTLKMWYTGRTASTAWKVGYAWSTDGGVTWTKHPNNPVMSPTQVWESTFLFLADVVHSGSQYKMWYTAGQSAKHHVGYATSFDELSWIRRLQPVLDPGPTSWDSQNDAWPSVLGPDSTGNFKMWYSGHGTWPYRRNIGYATAPNETTWTKYGSNSVLQLGSAGSWDDGGLEAPKVLSNDSGYKMWYSGYRTSFWSDSRIGFATSPDGISWSRSSVNPVLTLGPPGSWEGVSIFATDVLLEDNLYRMWYTGYDGSKIRIGYAISPKGMSFSFSPEDSMINSTADTIRITIRVDDPTGFQFSVKLKTSGLAVDTVQLFDDGVHGDSLAADGVFSNTWAFPDSNLYSLDFILTLNDTLQFEMNSVAELVTSVRQVVQSTPHEYALTQNYPNPFNPTTKIQFTIRDLRFTTLKIFDLLGREVAMLVNEKLEPGSYEITWEATGLPSGAYFYRLQAGEFGETKRLVILK